MNKEGKDWTLLDRLILKIRIKQRKDTIDIAKELGRSVKAIENKIFELGLSAKPRDN